MLSSVTALSSHYNVQGLLKRLGRFDGEEEDLTFGGEERDWARFTLAFTFGRFDGVEGP